eukprot:298937-Amphidinium_carterae.3
MSETSVLPRELVCSESVSGIQGELKHGDHCWIDSELTSRITATQDGLCAIYSGSLRRFVTVGHHLRLIHPREY